MLLARRLIEAGVRLVHVNWARDPGDNAVDNPLWDTHALNADRLQDNLCPQFDVTFAALMDDLSDRGLLDETLVVVIGEFGRTPKINANGGRDHWGHVFSFAMAGAGIQGGQVIGASDRNGAYPATTPFTGSDLTATIFHLLGIDPNGVFHDTLNRPHSITKGEPIAAMLTHTSAKIELVRSEGDPTFVPPFDTRLLFDAEFDASLPLVAPAPPTRDKGWRAFPVSTPAPESGLSVRKDCKSLRMGVGLTASPVDTVIEQGASALLAQEIRNARGGRYTLTIQAGGDASTAEEFDSIFLANFGCRLVLFRFNDISKDPRAVSELASADFRPRFGRAESFTLDRFLGSTSPGANFAIGSGLGVCIVIEKKTPGQLVVPKNTSSLAALRIESVSLSFSPRIRDDSVTA